MEFMLLYMAIKIMSAPAPSMKLKLKLKKGAYLVHGVREKTTWFVNNIAKTHPRPHIHIRRRRTSTSRFHKPTGTQEENPVLTETGSMVLESETYHRSPSPRALRSSKRMKVRCHSYPPEYDRLSSHDNEFGDYMRVSTASTTSESQGMTLTRAMLTSFLRHPKRTLTLNWKKISDSLVCWRMKTRHAVGSLCTTQLPRTSPA
ncbi:hypothetical protein L227DRAFT_264172 [Lentinus tigrinus ALCF2SS1-6]|uniref:Uncharacterized protein n=1 Tax=Lentinus tigrinus ALCF2SS1-6 TaxID=1328759 RepID=A0A5C2SND3_9APHY|nr:hypothetical protein L227DRAFT_264172 [Lentinus tigrinus ALCF2SS1-6]